MTTGSSRRPGYYKLLILQRTENITSGTGTFDYLGTWEYDIWRLKPKDEYTNYKYDLY